MSWVDDWTVVAACRGMDPDELFVQGAAQNRAKTVCSGCPVRTECLADALDNRVEFGVWGGMTERERRALLRRRPDVASWRRLLESARNHYERQVTAEAELDEVTAGEPASAAMLDAVAASVGGGSAVQDKAGSRVRVPRVPKQQRRDLSRDRSSGSELPMGLGMGFSR
jgi:WhiB family transcriptional regulator, redox-sensing transcriptional regulator